MALAGVVMLSIGDFARLGQVSPRMLRHYDKLGLLRPDQVDPETGYRSYGVSQLARLHRLVVLRDLGFSLEQIGELLPEAGHGDEVPLEQLRGMLRLRQAQIADAVTAEQARLRRVEAHLRVIEGTNAMKTYDIVVKDAPPLRIAEATAPAAGFGSENLAPAFATIMPAVFSRLAAAGVTPGVMVAHYEEPDDDGNVVVHGGCDIGDQELADTDTVRVVELATTRVAAVLHHGSMATVTETYEALLRWIADSGYRQTAFSRELYLEMDRPDSPANVTELQMPIAT